MDSELIISILLFYFVLLASLVFHEAAHALFALLGGDKTAYTGGQVSLNPIPHIKREPFGTILLPLVMLFGSSGTMCMGFATTPIDANWALRHPKRAALMSAAGPISNFLLVLIAVGITKLLVHYKFADNYSSSGGLGIGLIARPVDPDAVSIEWILRIATAFAFLNLLLGILNLFPWPPLDGAGVLSGLSPKIDNLYRPLRSNGFVVMGGMIAIAYFVLPEVLWPAWSVLLSWI